MNWMLSGIMEITPKTWQTVSDFNIPPTEHHFEFSGTVEGDRLTYTSYLKKWRTIKTSVSLLESVDDNRNNHL